MCARTYVANSKTAQTAHRTPGRCLMGARHDQPIWAREPIPGWYERSTCKGIAVDVFFLEQHEDLARRVCSSCPVRTQCRQWALEAGSSLAGTWGGLSEKERRAVRRKGAA